MNAPDRVITFVDSLVKFTKTYRLKRKLIILFKTCFINKKYKMKIKEYFSKVGFFDKLRKSDSFYLINIQIIEQCKTFYENLRIIQLVKVDVKVLILKVKFLPETKLH